jgi:hypothetical protein
MKKKTAYAVFTLTESGLDYMVKGNFGNNELAANIWASNFYNIAKYPNGLFVKKIKY